MKCYSIIHSFNKHLSVAYCVIGVLCSELSWHLRTNMIYLLPWPVGPCWLECCLVHQKVEGLIPSQGTHLGCRFNCLSRHMWKATNHCFSLSHIDISLSPSLHVSFSLSLPPILFKKVWPLPSSILQASRGGGWKNNHCIIIKHLYKVNKKTEELRNLSHNNFLSHVERLSDLQSRSVLEDLFESYQHTLHLQSSSLALQSHWACL